MYPTSQKLICLIYHTNNMYVCILLRFFCISLILSKILYAVYPNRSFRNACLLTTVVGRFHVYFSWCNKTLDGVVVVAETNKNIGCWCGMMHIFFLCYNIHKKSIISYRHSNVRREEVLCVFHCPTFYSGTF